MRKYPPQSGPAGHSVKPCPDLPVAQLAPLLPARPRRKLSRGLKRKPLALIKKLRKMKRQAVAGEKPEVVKTHLRNMVILPEMVGSQVGVYNGKVFTQVTFGLKKK